MAHLQNVFHLVLLIYGYIVWDSPILSIIISGISQAVLGVSFHTPCSAGHESVVTYTHSSWKEPMRM